MSVTVALGLNGGRRRFGAPANVNIARTSMFRHVGMGAITVSYRFAPPSSYDAKSPYGPYPPGIDTNMSVMGTIGFRFKGTDEVTRQAGLGDGNLQTVRCFLNGSKLPANLQSNNELVQLMRTEEALCLMGAFQQGAKDDHAGSEMIALTTDGAVTVENMSPYPIGAGDGVYASLPYPNGKEGFMRHGVKGGVHLMIGPIQILGHLSWSELIKNAELGQMQLTRQQLDDMTNPRANRSISDQGMEQMAHPIVPLRINKASAAVDNILFLAWFINNRAAPGTDAAKADLARMLYTERQQILTDLMKKASVAYAAFVATPVPDKFTDVSKDRIKGSLAGITGNSVFDSVLRSVGAVDRLKDQFYLGKNLEPSAPGELCHLNLHLR